MQFFKEPLYKKITIRITKEFDSFVRRIEKKNKKDGLSYNTIIRTLLDHGKNQYDAECEGRKLVMDEPIEIIFCQSCGHSPAKEEKFRKVHFKEDDFTFCNTCITDKRYETTLRNIERELYGHGIYNGKEEIQIVQTFI